MIALIIGPDEELRLVNRRKHVTQSQGQQGCCGSKQQQAQGLAYGDAERPEQNAEEFFKKDVELVNKNFDIEFVFGNRVVFPFFCHELRIYENWGILDMQGQQKLFVCKEPGLRSSIRFHLSTVLKVSIVILSW